MEQALSYTAGGNVCQQATVTLTTSFPTIWPLLQGLIATLESGRSELPHRENSEHSLIHTGRSKNISLTVFDMMPRKGVSSSAITKDVVEDVVYAEGGKGTVSS